MWGVHIRAANEFEDLVIHDVAVDTNTGESYVVGTMGGKITVEGRHLHMWGLFGRGQLTVAPSAVTWVQAAATSAATATSITDTATLATTHAADFFGKVVRVVDPFSTNAIKGNQDCSARALSVATGASGVLATTAFSKAGRACDFTGAGATDAYRIYSGSASFIVKFSKQGVPVWLNKLDMAATPGHQVVATSVAVDPTSGAHYVVASFSDGRRGAGSGNANKPVLNLYSVDAATQTVAASALAVSTITAMGTDAYGQTGSGVMGVAYEEGVLLKYSSAGQFLASESIKGGILTTQMVVSNLKVRVFHPSVTAIVVADAGAPEEYAVEYDYGMAGGGVLGGGTALRSTIQLAATAATYYPPSGQVLQTVATPTVATQPMDNWYNGLKISITCGKGAGQVRTIQDYDAATRQATVQPDWDGGTMVPDDSSCYVISGRSASRGIIGGQQQRHHHLSSGGVYVTGNVWSPSVASFANEHVCFGQMPDAYRDAASGATGIPVCGQASVANEEANFLARYDRNLRVYWVRFVYDGSAAAATGSSSNSGLITALEVVGDMVYVAGTYGKTQWGSGTGAVNLRLQNCSFDVAPATAEGAPANTPPLVRTLRKLCRSQPTTLTNVGNFPVQTLNGFSVESNGSFVATQVIFDF